MVNLERRQGGIKWKLYIRGERCVLHLKLNGFCYPWGSLLERSSGNQEFVLGEGPRMSLLGGTHASRSQMREENR